MRHGAFRLGKFRLGGRGVFRWGGLAFGEAVVVRHESFGPARHGVSWRLTLKGGVNE